MIRTYSYYSGGIMSSKLDSEREKRLAKTGKWFQGSSRDNNKDTFLTYVMPILLTISLCVTIFTALRN